MQPFLFNLFIDLDIIFLTRLFRFLQWPLAQFIYVLWALKSREGYAIIGGGFPLQKLTNEQGDALNVAYEVKIFPARVYVGKQRLC